MSQTCGAPANDKGRFESDVTTTGAPAREQRAASFAIQKRHLRDTMADIRNGRH